MTEDSAESLPNDEERRRILEMVAARSISPAEASELLDSLGRRPTSPDDDQDITGVRVQGTFRTLRVEGDSSISGAVAEGRYVARRENGTLVFEEDPDDEDMGFMLFGPRDRRVREFRTTSGRRIKIDADFGQGRSFKVDRDFPFHRPPILKVRMNPNLALEVDISAGPVKVIDVRGPIKAQIAAGSGLFEGVRGPIQISCDAGSVNVSGVIDHGESQVRCTAGKVRMRLQRGSSVRISARSTLGKISMPGSQDWAGIGGGHKEFVVGGGAGTLELEATTGLVAVEVES